MKKIELTIRFFYVDPTCDPNAFWSGGTIIIHFIIVIFCVDLILYRFRIAQHLQPVRVFPYKICYCDSFCFTYVHIF